MPTDCQSETGHFSSQLNVIQPKSVRSPNAGKTLSGNLSNYSSCVSSLSSYDHADQDQPVDNSIFHLCPLPRPDSLPRTLTEEDAQRLTTYVQNRLKSSDPLLRLENAYFFVLAHTGVRAAECVDLQFQDFDLSAGRLTVRQGKGQRDRVVYLSDTARRSLQNYLGDTPHGPTDPLWTRPTGQPITDGWLREHIAALSQAAGVQTSPRIAYAIHWPPTS